MITHKTRLYLEAIVAVLHYIIHYWRLSFYRSFIGRMIWMGAKSSAPNMMAFTYPAHLRVGQAARGAAWLAGDLTLAGGRVRIAADALDDLFTQTTPSSAPSVAPSSAPSAAPSAAPSTTWRAPECASLHSFDWLCDVLAVNSDDATRAAAQWMLDWAKGNFIHHKIAMRPDITARRLMAWSAAWSRAPHIGVGDIYNQDNIARLTTRFAQQAHWLYLTAAHTRGDVPRLTALCGLVFAYLALPHKPDHLRYGIDMLMREIPKQILPDGGHISRAPETTARFLDYFLAIGAGFNAHNIALPAHFSETIRRMANMVRFLCHHDGSLACFHGGTQGDATRIAPLIKTVITRGKKNNMAYADKSGYQRLAQGKTCLLMDVGAPATGRASTAAHAAPLSFEMSHNKERLIVNCGTHKIPNKIQERDWQLALRGAAAHSVLSFDDSTHAPILADGWVRRVLGARLCATNWRIHHRRNEDNRGIWLEAGHSAFVADYGVRHNRRLFMAASGEDMRGEDLLIATPSVPHDIATRAPYHFHLRFHLHPDITATLLSGGDGVLLVAPSGHGWHLRIACDDGNRLQIEDSVYMGVRGMPQHSRQVSIGGTIHKRRNKPISQARIRWALRYAGRSGHRAKAG